MATSTAAAANIRLWGACWYLLHCVRYRALPMDDDLGLGLSSDEDEPVVSTAVAVAPTATTSALKLGGSHPGAGAVVSSYKDAKVLSEVHLPRPFV